MGSATTDAACGLSLDGRYRIEDVIGRGGMATVYRARDEVLGREVAIKLFPPTSDKDEALRHEAEIGVLAQLNHPALVALFDAGTAPVVSTQPQIFIVMELVAGPTLADVIRIGPLSAEHTAWVGSQLTGALEAVHAAQVVHRDIKPANVLLVEPYVAGRPMAPPVVKLTDFGIARLIDGARLTVTGTSMGTAAYLSPEQAAGGPVGPPTDVYSLGLVLLECLAGRRALTGTVAEVVAARLTASPVIPDDLGVSWRSLLADMTRRDPEERIAVADAGTRLAALADSAATVVLPSAITPDAGTVPVRSSEVPVPDLPPAGHEEGPRRARWAGALVIAAVAAVLVLVAAVLGRPGGVEESAEPPSYPAVDGSLGRALDDLVRSVHP